MEEEKPSFILINKVFRLKYQSRVLPKSRGYVLAIPLRSRKRFIRLIVWFDLAASFVRMAQHFFIIAGWKEEVYSLF